MQHTCGELTMLTTVPQCCPVDGPIILQEVVITNRGEKAMILMHRITHCVYWMLELIPSEEGECM